MKELKEKDLLKVTVKEQDLGLFTEEDAKAILKGCQSLEEVTTVGMTARMDLTIMAFPVIRDLLRTRRLVLSAVDMARQAVQGAPTLQGDQPPQNQDQNPGAVDEHDDEVELIRVGEAASEVNRGAGEGEEEEEATRMKDPASQDDHDVDMEG